MWSGKIDAYDLLDYLKREGYIEKIAQSETGFYCTSKTCTKVLESDFKSFGVPTSRYDLRERLRKYASKNAKGAWEAAPDLVTRCLICAYRGYRQLYKRRYQQFPDDDVPDDFNTNSEAPKMKSPVKQRARSPVRQTAPKSQPNVNTDAESQLYQGFSEIIMTLILTGSYAVNLPLEWLKYARRSLYFGLLVSQNSAIDLFHPVWYLPTNEAWGRYVRQPLKYSLQDLAEFHYLDERLQPGFLINPHKPAHLKVKASDVKVIKTIKTNIRFTLPNGSQQSHEVIIRVIDQVLRPEPQAAPVDRDAVYTAAIRAMTELGADYWASLWELAVKRNKIPNDYPWPEHPVFIVPDEEDIQYIMTKHVKANTFLLDPGPTAVGWEIFLCNFGSVQGMYFTSVKGYRFVMVDQHIDGQEIADTKSIGNAKVILIRGLLSVEDLTAKVRK